MDRPDEPRGGAPSVGDADTPKKPRGKDTPADAAAAKDNAATKDDTGDKPDPLPAFLGPPEPLDRLPGVVPAKDAAPAQDADDDPYAAAFADKPRRASVWPLLLSIVVPLGLVGAVGWWLWQERVGVVQWAVPRVAALRGLDVGLTVNAVGPGGLTATGITVGGVRADNVTATYTVGGLLQGQAETLTVDGLRVEARQVDGAWRIDGLPAGDGGAGGGVPRLPFSSLVVSGSTVAVVLPEGTVAATGDGSVETDAAGVVAVAWQGDVDGGDLGGGTVVLSGDVGAAENGLAVDLVVSGEGALGGSALGPVLARAKGGGSVEVSGVVGTARQESFDLGGSFSLADVWFEAPAWDVAVAGVNGAGSFDMAADGAINASLTVEHDGAAFGGWRFGPGPLAVRQEDGVVRAEGLVDTAVGRFETRITGTPTAPDAPVEVVVAGTLNAASAAALIAGFAADGTADVELAVQAENLGGLTDDIRRGEPPGDFAGWLALADRAGLVVEGRIDADLVGVTSLRHFSGGALRGPLAGRLDSAGLTLAGLGPVAARVSRITIPGLDGLTEVLPVEVLFGGAAGTPLRLDIAREGETFDVSATGGLAVDGLDFSVAAEVDGAVTVTPDGIGRVDVPFVLASLGGVAVPGGRGDVEVLVSDLAGFADDLTGVASVGLSAPLLALGGASLAGITGEVDADIGWDGAVLKLMPHGGSRVDLGGVSGPGGLRAGAPVALVLADTAQSVTVARDGGVAMDITLADLAPVTVQRGRDEPLATFDLGALRLRQDGGDFRALFTGGTVVLPGRPVALAEIDGSAGFVAGRGATADLTIGQVVHTGTPAAVVPLAADLKVTPEADGRLAVEGRAADAGGRIKLALTGHHDPASGRGEGELVLDRLSFLPTVLQPAALFPALQGRFGEVDGDIGFAGTMAWGDGRVAVPGTLTFEARSLAIDEVAVENARGAIVFDDLISQRTPPGQRISVGLIDVGVPLTNGEVIVHLPGDGTVNAQLAGLEMFGGALESDPFTIDRATRDFETALRVKGMALDRMLAATKGAGELSVSGTLDGVIPLRFKDGEASINGGELATTAGGGVLRYAPGDVGVLDEEEFSTGLFLDAVKNFHYDSINLTLNEGEAEDLLLGLHLRGNNPDLYGGAPLELNVNLEGPLQQILTRGLATYSLPTRLGEELGTGALP